MYRPISLTNTDYKIIMRIWANRLGPMLNSVVGGHQLGFIPGRDGRENVINEQFLIDYYQHKGLRGAVVFLDLQKAFDRVSHEALMLIMRHHGWPEEFVGFVENVYLNNTARLIVNGELSKESVDVSSGTRQGCPLSPLLFTLIAEMLCQPIINDPEFKGMKIEGGNHKALSAYADDIAINNSCNSDLDIMNDKLDKFERATGMRVNKKKSEAVVVGRWVRAPPPELLFRCVRKVKYLGCPVGRLTDEDYTSTWEAMEDKLDATFRRWNRAATAPKDRMLLAKTMALSKLWYMASVIPWSIQSLRRIQKTTIRYIWGFKMHKVSMSQLLLPKKNLGLNMWSLVAKVRALNARWGLHYTTKRLSPTYIA
jgi:hypothetical protein